jgi:hypothetical protein
LTRRAVPSSNSILRRIEMASTVKALSMSDVTLHIPLRLAQQNGFFNLDGQPQKIFGFIARLKREPPYCYLEMENVPAREADAILDRVRHCLTWAAVRLDMGIVTDREPLKRASDSVFDGQFATAYPTGMQAKPIRVAARHRTEEPSTRLFAALNEGSGNTKIVSSAAENPTLLACEFFAAADFEVTANSQFLMLSTVFEVLANPKTRPTLCVYLIEDLLESAKKAEAVAESMDDPEMKDALKSLRDSAIHLKEESITSSVRKLATKVSRVLGDPEPEKAGKHAATLYGKRSTFVHTGKSVTWANVAELRKMVREALAVEVGCHERVRERFP